MEQREFIVEAEGAGQRIDRFLSGEDTGLSPQCAASPCGRRSCAVQRQGPG